jgi:para-aminobenzoate synthetase/4-amino-4-deoxychorismate lyase
MQGFDTSQPFVLLDDARQAGGSHARLFTRPRGVVTAYAPDQVEAALEQLRLAIALGRTAAGFISYDAGLALEPRLKPLYQSAPDELPLIWMGLFDSVETIPSEKMADRLPSPDGAWIGPPEPGIGFTDYSRMVETVQTLIAAGDIYQANLTFPATVSTAGEPLALYARMRRSAGAGWGAIVHTGQRWILSASPELFFSVNDGEVVARPMKGTAIRSPDAKEDDARVQALRSNPKERAENLMIVDLIRNDLSRIAAPGSVDTTSLFDIETYPTIHQMTSTVTARLGDGHGVVEVLKALFPCGSVTGAPKIRAMEIIGETEKEPRGLYTGSIGWLGPTGDGAFNVAIRTLILPEEPGPARLNLGSALVADSKTDAEWRECLAKGAFANAGNAAFDLIETMRFDPDEGIVHLALHLQRMESSARNFGFAFNRHDIRNELQAAVFALREPRKVRLLLGPSGAAAIETAVLPDAPQGPVAIAIMPLPVAPGDFRLRHKTTARGFYDSARRASGAFEVIFTDPEGRVTEGSFTNVFVERAGLLLTPALQRGVLPGILRQTLIESGRAHEAELTPADLANGFFIGNALRGLIPAQLVASNGQQRL